MEQYIPKSALVAEIDRQKIGYNTDGKHSVEYDITRKIIDIINSLEVKEVDLEKEIDNYLQPLAAWEIQEAPFTSMENIAKHFFELGVWVNNPITAADRGMAEEIIINLKRVENDYRINLTKEIEWLRNKVKKGEEI